MRSLLRFLTRILAQFVRFTLPLLGSLLLRSMQLVVFALVMWFRGLWEAIGKLAYHMQNQAAYKGYPSDLEKIFRVFGYILVISELVVGWVVAAYLTVFLLNTALMMGWDVLRIVFWMLF